MLNVAAEISQLVHAIGKMEEIGVKVAAADCCALAQTTNAKASTALYNVINKCAQEFVPGDMPNHFRMVQFADKTASVLGRPAMSCAQRLKLASAVASDDAITEIISLTPGAHEREKLAEAQAFGREFVMEILRGVV